MWSWGRQIHIILPPCRAKKVGCGEEMTGYSVLIFSASSEETSITQHWNTVGEYVLNESESEVAQSCYPPGCSIHGIFQARVLEWVAIFFSRGSS